MLAVLATSLILLAAVQSADCPDVPSCRSAADAAAARGDFEAFHDLAWRTVQKGRANDPELMMLLARAQSLSGRPGDALVMLQRLARMGVRTDAATSEDFARVRTLPGWSEVERTLAAPPTELSPAAAPGTEPAAPVATAGPSPTVSGAAVRDDADTDEEALPPPFDEIEPAGLAYDGVSRRFIVGDRRSHKLVIFDDVFKRATDMIRPASSGFFGIAAVEIDSRRGDLWVANSSASGGASVTKLQLVSGRVLFDVPVPAALGRASFVDAAVLPDGAVLLVDAEGRRLLRVAAGKREFQLAASIDVQTPTSLAILDGHVYVAHARGIARVALLDGKTSPVGDAPPGLLRIRARRGGLVAVQSDEGALRIVSLRLGKGGRVAGKLEVLDERPAMPGAAALTVVDGVVCYIASGEDGPVIRRIRTARGRPAAPRR